MTTILITFCLALLLSLVLTPIAGRIGRWLGAMDTPNARKVHNKPVARTGGVAVFCAFLLTVVLGKCYRTAVTDLLVYSREVTFLASGGLMVFAIGLVDDFRGVNSKIKLLVQVLAATVAFYGGVNVGSCRFGGLVLELGVCNYVTTVFWFVLFINAINLIDGLDGLAGGVAFFASLVMVVLSVLRNDFLMAMLFSCLCGSVLGFLRYNFNPASIFLGDSGSYFIGYTIAGFAILGSVKSQVGVVVLIPLVALGVPLFDTLLAPVRRFLRGQKIFGADAGHIHHRLLKLGLSTRRAVLILYAATVGLGLIALLMVNMRNEQAGLLLGILAVGAVVFVRKLGYFEYIASDKLIGWFKDLGDEAGFSKERRSFLSLQIDIGQSETLAEMWQHAQKAFAMVGLDKALFYLASETMDAPSPSQVLQYVDGKERRHTDRTRASICMRQAPPEYSWTAESRSGTDIIASRCLFRLELPLLGEADTYLGTLVAIKDKASGGLKPYVLRRMETLRRTMASTIENLMPKRFLERPDTLQTSENTLDNGAQSGAFGIAANGAGGHRFMNWRRGDILLMKLLGWKEAAGWCAESFSKEDWQSAIDAAGRHLIAPQLYLAVKRGNGALRAPDWVMEALRNRYLNNARRNLRLFHELGTVLFALKQAGIDVIVLKGAHLGENIYRNISARTLTDVDLLFRKQDFQRANDFLRKKHLLSTPGGLFLDLHWKIDFSIANLLIDMEPVWQRAFSVRISNREALALSHEDLLLHLCLHMAFHHRMQYAGLRTLCDIREILRRFGDDLNWPFLFQEARRLGIQNAVHLALFLAKDFINAPIPKAVSERFMRGKIAAPVRQWAIEKIFSEENDIQGLSPYFWEIFGFGPWYRKLPFVRKLLVPSQGVIEQAYHAKSSLSRLIFNYVARFQKRMFRYSKALLRILVRDQDMMAQLRKQRENLGMRKWMMGGG